MKTAIPLNTSGTAVSTRHAPNCCRKGDRFYKGKGRNCLKALYIRENGLDRRMSAKTRSRVLAEKLAPSERDRRGPVKRKLLKIAEEEAQRAVLRKSKDITLPDATDRWPRQRWRKSKETKTIYRYAARRISPFIDKPISCLPCNASSAARTENPHRTSKT